MLTLSQVRVAYEQPVLHGIDLDVAAGEIVCILGPSGGGKSTLLRAVAGLVEYTGSIAIAGRAVDRVPPHRRGVGLMFQDDLLFGHLDVAGNVGFGSRGARVREMLDLVGLPEFGPRAVDTLSGGQAQRVALARALAPAPRVLLLDEPFGALDVVLKAELTRQVQQVLRASGSTVLAVTHDRSEAFTLADRVAILREGRLVQVGTPDALWRHPADEYVAGLVGLSVIDSCFYAPSELVVDEAGPWEAVVTGRTFSGGVYLVSGDVAGSPVTYAAAHPPEIGTRVRLRPARSSGGPPAPGSPASPAS
jgi:thiamine transport system ATP-binding protein